GGTGGTSNAIADAAREAGAEILTEAPIAKIILKNCEAKGVVLENGDEIYADVISSSVDPRLTFMKMVGEEHLPEDFVDDIKRYRSEERRVGKECRGGWSTNQSKKKQKPLPSIAISRSREPSH